MRKKTKAASALPEVKADENGGVGIAEGDARVDTMENRGKMNGVVFARNAVWEIARKVGVKYFCVLDDDYKQFCFRWRNGEKLDWADCSDLDSVFSAMADFLIASGADTVAMAQAGDFVGGIGSTAAGHPLLRKAMNVFFFRADRPCSFVGMTNEDVNMYVLANLRGRLILTLTSVMIVQMVTQTNSGGLTDIYLQDGTYVKSFYSVMCAPSCVKISMLHGGTKDTAQHWRIHHHVKWNNCAPKILSEKWRKRGKRARG
ncbi:MAG: hypothetical protein J6V72_10995 [Kiritimatiellae bacterium]|nr:hypothetical protein [Kiritimatiellia bacterium]